MKFSIEVSRQLATISIRHAMQYGKIISSHQKFVKAIKSYIILYGELCVDDHESEYGFEDEAEEIVNKYFKE